MKSIRFLIAIFAVSAISLQFIGDPPKIRTIGSGPYVKTEANETIIPGGIPVREEKIGLGYNVFIAYMYEHKCTSINIQNVVVTKNSQNYTNFQFVNRGGGKTEVVVSGLNPGDIVDIKLTFFGSMIDAQEVSLSSPATVKMAATTNNNPLDKAKAKTASGQKITFSDPCIILVVNDLFAVTGQNVQTNPNRGGSQKN